jgi:hypothetical protein
MDKQELNYTSLLVKYIIHDEIIEERKGRTAKQRNRRNAERMAETRADGREQQLQIRRAADFNGGIRRR